MEKKYKLILKNIDGVDFTIESDDFDKIVVISNEITSPKKEPRQLEGKPKIVYTKS